MYSDYTKKNNDELSVCKGSTVGFIENYNDGYTKVEQLFVCAYKYYREGIVVEVKNGLCTRIQERILGHALLYNYVQIL